MLERKEGKELNKLMCINYTTYMHLPTTLPINPYQPSYTLLPTYEATHADYILATTYQAAH